MVNSYPYKYLRVSGIGGMFIEGDRDALVELRSAINEALAHGHGEAPCTYANGDETTVTVERFGA
jgi:hypothetical protein